MLATFVALVHAAAQMPHYKTDIRNDGTGRHNPYLSLSNASQCSDVSTTRNGASTLCLLRNNVGWQYNTFAPGPLDVYSFDHVYDVVVAENVAAVLGCDCDAHLLWSSRRDNDVLQLRADLSLRWARRLTPFRTSSASAVLGSDLRSLVSPEKTTIASSYTVVDTGRVQVVVTDDGRRIVGWNVIISASNGNLSSDFDRPYAVPPPPPHEKKSKFWWAWTLATIPWLAFPSRATAIVAAATLGALVAADSMYMNASSRILAQVVVGILAATLFTRRSRLFFVLRGSSDGALAVLAHRLARSSGNSGFSDTLSQLLVSWSAMNAAVSFLGIIRQPLHAAMTKYFARANLP